MSRWWHRLGVLVVGLVLLAVATVYDGWLPGDDDDPGSASFVRSIGVREQVSLRTLTLEVDSVTGAATIDRFGSELRSPGLWVVVQYTVTATQENDAIGFAELRDGHGRVWSLPHGRSANTCPAGPPGVPVGCVALFEVPVDALPTLRLRLAPREEQRYDTVADVDLGLTASDAEAFASVTALEVPGTTLGGR